MGSVILSAAGSAIGGVIGGPIGSALGNIAGNIVGSNIDSHIFGKNKNHSSESYRLKDLQIQTSTYGKMIPKIFGTTKIAGNIIWADDIKEIAKKTGSSYRTKHGKVSQTHTDYIYFANFAISLSCTQIEEVINIWADNVLINPTSYNIRIYNGTEEQLPDPLIESKEGVGKTPAFRGQAYVVFEHFPLSEFGNRIPNFNFEVKTKSDNTSAFSLENLVRSLVIIPGSGEFVYDMEIQYKEIGVWHGKRFHRKGKARSLNMHNTKQKANALIAIEQMLSTFPNLEWISPVVNWFCTSIDAGKCQIFPGVEYKDGLSTFPNTWHVASNDRQSAYQIIQNNGFPNYGGTPSDCSILKFVTELKGRGLKVMLNPMLLVDTTDKPWRGRITGNSDDLSHFFNNENGYTKFILHYANLLKDHIDGFVIGSELIGITSLNNNGDYPGVDHLVTLAEQVKEIVGNDVIVTYAADWSEYHRAPNGDYNMDKLWASDAIDVVGIDAYFPLTNEQGSIYNKQKLISAWDKGEGIEYYYSNSKKTEKKPLRDDYAWKNLEYWWHNHHYHPDGTKTDWQPKSKKIWFTEYGFPSIDACTNQPNVFFDPAGGIESKMPIHSKGNIDFKAQRTAIEATELRWKDSDIVANKFLWTWDARPYPSWPQFKNVWRDHQSYYKGHWIQGKVGLSSISQVIKSLCLIAGYEEEDLEFIGTNDSIHGFVIEHQTSFWQTIMLLAKAYNFIVVSRENKLCFIDLNELKYRKISNQHLLEDNHKIYSITHKNTTELPSHIHINFYDSANQYIVTTQSCMRDSYSNNQHNIAMPIITSCGHARKIAATLLAEAEISSHIISFTLPPAYINIKVGEVAVIQIKNVEYKILVSEVIIGNNLIIRVRGHRFEPNIYSYTSNSIQENNGANQAEISPTILEILDIPNLENNPTEPVIYLAATGYLESWKGANILMSKAADDFYNEVASFSLPSTMGVTTERLGKAFSNMISSGDSLNINLFSGELSSIHADLLAQGQNLALIGNEIIQFKEAEMIADSEYKISGLVRGLFGTEDEISKHSAGERFILLDDNIKKIPLHSYNLFKGQEISFKAVSYGDTIGKTDALPHRIQLKSVEPLSLFKTIAVKHSNTLEISWERRCYKNANFLNISQDDLLEFTKELYMISILYENGDTREEITTDNFICLNNNENKRIKKYAVKQINPLYS